MEDKLARGFLFFAAASRREETTPAERLMHNNIT
jgi:hypothetical protein